MLSSPLSLELYAREFQRERMAEAAHAALAAQLPRRSSPTVLGDAGRRWLADGLRVLACRLDPGCAACGPRPLIAAPR